MSQVLLLVCVLVVLVCILVVVVTLVVARGDELGANRRPPIPGPRPRWPGSSGDGR